MNAEQVKNLMDSCRLPGTCTGSEIKETHISWIILYDDYAFKIKKPVKYSFLDFSTLDRRKFFCDQELALNRRLAPEMYLDVLAITEEMVDMRSGGRGRIIDYAVQMKRMDNSKEMDVLLRSGNISGKQVTRLAEKIALFHKNAKVIIKDVNISDMQELYEDIKTVVSYLNEKGHHQWEERIYNCIGRSDNFLEDKKEMMDERVRDGFFRDCHGDLNSSNIFLYEDPVIFDCIEFNQDFRQIDILNEIAFLCVDIDFFEKKELGNLFHNKYLEYSGMRYNTPEKELFLYYNSFRANVRAKVTLIDASKKSDQDVSAELEDAFGYLEMMEQYIDAL